MKFLARSFSAEKRQRTPFGVRYQQNVSTKNITNHLPYYCRRPNRFDTLIDAAELSKMNRLAFSMQIMNVHKIRID